MHTDKPTTEQSNRSHNNAFSRTLSRLLFYQSKKNGEAKAFLNSFMLECPRLFAA